MKRGENDHLFALSVDGEILIIQGVIYYSFNK